MALCNSIKIAFRGETLAYIDPAEIKAVEPYHSYKPMSISLPKRVTGWLFRWWKGEASGEKLYESFESLTKITFRDGTWMKIRMPFYEFVNAYC